MTHSKSPYNLFSQIAKNVWDDVIYHHSSGIEISEIGITKKIVATLRHNAAIGIWANQGYKEVVNGSDIDIFIELRPGEYAWYALQAKALQSNLQYAGIDKISEDTFQWEKLETLERKSGCLSFYLLYNGISNYMYQHGPDFCNRNFSSEQLGCSIIEYDLIKQLSISPSGMHRTIEFHDIHPDTAQPWRVITGCNLGFRKLYSLKQIKNRVKLYKNLSAFTFTDSDEDYSNFTGVTNSADPEEIVKISKETDWNPGYSLLINSNYQN